MQQTIDENFMDDDGWVFMDDESIPKVKYGNPELPISDAITFYQAASICRYCLSNNSLDIKELLCSNVIRAFESNNKAEFLRPVLNIKDWLEQHEYANTFSDEKYRLELVMSRFRYSKQEVIALYQSKNEKVLANA